MKIEDIAVILHLKIEIKPDCLQAFRDYIDKAFPIFEATGGSKGMVYACEEPNCFDEVFYYQSEEAFQAGDRAIQENPVQAELLKHWRSLLVGPPIVEVRRLSR